ncbi:hypothetical protein QTP88_009796 [Uroleucon formosanum]
MDEKQHQKWSKELDTLNNVHNKMINNMSRFMNGILNKVHKSVVSIAIGLTVISTGVFILRSYEILFVPVDQRVKARQEVNELLNNEQLLHNEE